MNVLLVTPFRLRGAGVATMVTRLQASLRERGHRAHLLEPGDSDSVARLPGSRGDHHGIYLRSPHVEGATLKSFVAFWLYLPVSLFRLWWFLKRQHIDVVHLQFVTPLALYFALLRKVSGWKLVATFHGSDAYSLPRRGPLYRTLLAVTLAQVDVITTVSSDLLRAVTRVYPRVRDRSRSILNGNPVVEPTLESGGSRPALPKDYVLAVGSLITRKAYDVLVTATAVAGDAGHPFDVVIVGGGPEEASLAALASRLGVRDRIHFAGEVSHADIATLYRGAKFFVHPAREEAQGLVLLEAMSSGTAVIASRVNGIPEVIRDGETGLLVEADNVRSFAAAMIRLEEDQQLRAALAARGQAYVSAHHNWDRFVDRYLEVYRSVLGAPEQ